MLDAHARHSRGGKVGCAFNCTPWTCSEGGYGKLSPLPVFPTQQIYARARAERVRFWRLSGEESMAAEQLKDICK